MNLDTQWEWKTTKLPCKIRCETGNPSVDELKELLSTLLVNFESKNEDKDSKVKEQPKPTSNISVVEQLMKIQTTLGLKELSDRHHKVPFNTAIKYLSEQEEMNSKVEKSKRNIHKKFVTAPISPPGKIMMDLHLDRLFRQEHNKLRNEQDNLELDSARGESVHEEKQEPQSKSGKSKKEKSRKGGAAAPSSAVGKVEKAAGIKQKGRPSEVFPGKKPLDADSELGLDDSSSLAEGKLGKKAKSVFKKEYKGDLFGTHAFNMEGNVYMSRLAVSREGVFGHADVGLAAESSVVIDEALKEEIGEDSSQTDAFSSTDEWTRRDLDAKLTLAGQLLRWSRHPSNAKRLKAEGAVQAIVRLINYKDHRVRILCVAALRHMASINALRMQLLGAGQPAGSSVAKILSDLMQSNPRNKGIIKDCVITLVHLTCMASDGSGSDEEKSVEARMVEEGVVAALKSVAEGNYEDLSELCMIGLYNLTCVNKGYQYIDRVIKAFTQLASPSHLNTQVSRICASAFCNLCDLTECHSRLIEEGVVSSVSILVNRSNSDPQTHRICAIVLHLLAQTPIVCSELISKNVLSVLENLALLSDGATLHYCAMAYLRLAKDKSSQVRVAQDGADPLANIAKTMPDKPLTSRPCATALKILSSRSESLKNLTQRKEVVSALVMLLHRSPDELTILHALQTLCNLLGSESPPTDELLDRSKGALVHVMKLSHTDFQEPGIHWACCLMLFNLSCIEAGKAPIVEGGAVPAILHLSQKPDMQLKQWCAMTLCNLASVPSSVGRMVKEGALPAFIDLLKTKDTTTVKYCCAALCLVARDAEDCLRVMEQGAVPCMIEGAEDGDVTTKQSSCAVLSALSAQEECRSQLVESGALPALMSLSKLDDPTTRDRCVIALANLSCEAAVQGLMVDAGVVPVLAELSFTHSEQSQQYCAKALCNLTCHHGSEQKIIDQDGISSLLMICMVRSVDKETKRVCTKALLNLINDSTIKKLVEEGIITACTALSKLKDDAETLLACSNIYAVLSANQYARKVLLERGGALQALLSLLESTSDHTTQVNCGKAICNMLSFDDSQVPSVRKGAVPLLNRLARLGDAETEIRCADTYFLLTDNFECRTLMRGRGGDMDDDPSLEVKASGPGEDDADALGSAGKSVYNAPSFAVMIFLARGPNPRAKWSISRSLCMLSWHKDSRNDLVLVNVVPALVALIDDAVIASSSPAGSSIGAEVLELCCRALAYLSFEPTHLARMARDKVVCALAHILDVPAVRQDTLMIDLVLVTLRCLSEAEDGVRVMLMEQGVVQLIQLIVGFDHIKGVPHIFFNAAVVLFKISCCERLRQMLIQQEASKILHTLVQYESCHSLVAATIFLLSIFPFTRETIVKQGMVDILMVLSNVNNLEDPSKLGLITSCTLAFFCISKEFKVQSILKEKGLIPTLVKLSKSPAQTVHSCSGDALKNLSTDSGSGVEEGTVSALINRSFESTTEPSQVEDEEEKIEFKLIAPDMPTIEQDQYKPSGTLSPALKMKAFRAYTVSYMKLEGGAAGQGPKPPEPPPMHPERIEGDYTEPSVVKGEDEDKGQKVMAYAKMDVPAHFDEPDDLEEYLKPASKYQTAKKLNTFESVMENSDDEDSAATNMSPQLLSSILSGGSSAQSAIGGAGALKVGGLYPTGLQPSGSNQGYRPSTGSSEKFASNPASKSRDSNTKRGKLKADKTLEQQRQDMGLW